MDIVFVRELRFKTIVGCWDWERQVRQEVSIDLEMGWDMSAAAASQNLSEALDYKAVSVRVRDFVVDQQFELVEAAAHAIADLVMQEFAVPWVRVRFSKPFAVAGAKAVGAVVEKGEK